MSYSFQQRSSIKLGSCPTRFNNEEAFNPHQITNEVTNYYTQNDGKTYVFASCTLQCGEGRSVATWQVGLGWAGRPLEVREVGVSILHCTVYKPEKNRSTSAKGATLRPT